MSKWFEDRIYETFDLGDGYTGYMVYDPDPQPWDGDEPGEIAYLKRSRECLGTEAVSEERMDEINEGIRSGEYLGLPVYAYVHSGATIRCGPFGDPWDSGQSGFVYCDPVKARETFGFTSDEDILNALRGQVKLHDNYLQGEVFGYVVEDPEGEEVDSCWGFYGTDEKNYINECAQDVADHYKEMRAKEERARKRKAAHERREARYWAQRDVVTR